MYVFNVKVIGLVYSRKVNKILIILVEIKVGFVSIIFLLVGWFVVYKFGIDILFIVVCKFVVIVGLVNC